MKACQIFTIVHFCKKLWAYFAGSCKVCHCDLTPREDRAKEAYLMIATAIAGVERSNFNLLSLHCHLQGCAAAQVHVLHVVVIIQN